MKIPSPKLPKGRVRDAVEAIGISIVRGEYPEGEVLPNEDTLAARAGVGRPALREAIKVLSGKGLVRTARRYGSRVCPRPEWNTLDPDVLSWHLSDPANWHRFLRDTVEMRVLLEPRAAAMAAERATPAEAAYIAGLAARMPVSVAAADIEVDVAFHAAVMRASHNGIMAGLAPSMEVLLRAYFTAIWSLRPEGPSTVPGLNLHQAMAAAMSERDPARAAECMQAMLAFNAGEIDELVGRLARPPALPAQPGPERRAPRHPSRASA